MGGGVGWPEAVVMMGSRERETRDETTDEARKRKKMMTMMTTLSFEIQNNSFPLRSLSSAPVVC